MKQTLRHARDRVRPACLVLLLDYAGRQDAAAGTAAAAKQQAEQRAAKQIESKAEAKRKQAGRMQQQNRVRKRIIR